MNQQAAAIAAATGEDAAGLFRRLGWSLFLVAAAAALILGWRVSSGEYYTPGSDFGYNLGLIGAIMMLVMLLYPLRKRVRFMQSWGPLRHWFRIHMILGILGPVLIVFHATFHVGSVNALVALTCMLLVSGSGIIGRFVYAKIHHGLYGRNATLQEMQAHMGSTSEHVKSKFHFAPDVEASLKRFEAYAINPDAGTFAGFWRFLTIVVRAKWVIFSANRALKRTMTAHAKERQWDREKFRQRYHMATQLVAAYVRAVHHAAQFRAYERTFSLWHVLHIPLVYMLAFSAVFHVIAVHMY